MVDEVVCNLDKDIILSTFRTILIESIVFQELLEQDVGNLDYSLVCLGPKLFLLILFVYSCEH